MYKLSDQIFSYYKAQACRWLLFLSFIPNTSTVQVVLKYVTCHTKITKRVASVEKVTQLFHCHAWNLDSFYWLLYIFFSFTWENLVLEPGDVSWLTILYFMFSSIVCLWFWSFLWIDSMNQFSGFPSLQYVAGQEVQIWAGPFGCRGRGEARHSLQ